MDRSNKQKWKLVGQKSYKDHEATINIIKDKSPDLVKKYDFEPDYDLADALVGILHKYTLDIKQPPAAKQLLESKNKIDEILRTSSLHGAGLLEIIELKLGGNLKSIDEPVDRKTRNKLKRAARITKTQGLKSKQGRYEKPDVTVARTFPIIYFNGTGDLPSCRYKNKAVHGKYIDFANEACQILEIEITPAKLAKYMIMIRAELNKRTR